MEQTECLETLAYKIQTLGNYPEESIQEEESFSNYYYLSQINLFNHCVQQ
jgi:hypothetical protein